MITGNCVGDNGRNPEYELCLFSGLFVFGEEMNEQCKLLEN